MPSDVRFLQLADHMPFRYAVQLDWLMTDQKLIADGLDLQSAVIVALGTDAVAGADDELPDPDSTDRRGWWGDLDANEIWGGWPVGCKLWLLQRVSITGVGSVYGSTVNRADSYTRDAMKPFTQNRIASQIDVVAEQIDTQRIDVGVVVYRGPRVEVELRYSELWDQLGGR
jgi:phage gp46-like protein